MRPVETYVVDVAVKDVVVTPVKNVGSAEVRTVKGVLVAEAAL
jgi:translation initiation factor 6 (eIF-6)